MAIITFSLPFAEHLQTFLGFPIRLLTAKIVSGVMSFLGFSAVSDSTVILTENNASNIDLPCSGIKSLYTGMIVLFTLFFLKKIRWSLNLLMISTAYFSLLILFNVWRVFSLVYIYDVLDFPGFADAIHVGIGIIGFFISTLVLWHLLEKYGDKKEISNVPLLKNKSVYKKTWLIILLIVVILLDSSRSIFFKKEEVGQLTPSTFSFTFPQWETEEIPLTEKEEAFFSNQDVLFSKKYNGKTSLERPFSLLLIGSASWRSHHNPEVCLQGMGYSIEGSEIFQLNGLKIKKLWLNGGEDVVFYWFVNGEKAVADYSERVWEGMKHPSETWTLIEIGFKGDVELDSPEIIDLIEGLHEFSQSAAFDKATKGK